MLISCSSCNSKFLVNSADLKPNGRTVQCAKCGHNWFQTASLDKEEVLSHSAPSTNDENKNLNHQNSEVVNLPSTYVKEQKVSIVNSILIVVFTFVLLWGIWFLKKNDVDSFILINFYIHEFYFNLKLLINDLAKIVYHILN